MNNHPMLRLRLGDRVLVLGHKADTQLAKKAERKFGEPTTEFEYNGNTYYRTSDGHVYEESGSYLGIWEEDKQRITRYLGRR